MSARDAVLARLRAGLGPDPITPDVPRDYRGAGREGLGAATEVDLVELLVERLEDYRARVVRSTERDVAAAVQAALGPVRRFLVPAGLPAAWLPADQEAVVDPGSGGRELDAFHAVVTGAALGIAVTGTIVLDAAPDQGRRALSLVPDLHVCILAASRIVAGVPEAIARLEADRPQTWISGPSATSDIELDRVEGVHGPRTLHVVILTDR